MLWIHLNIPRWPLNVWEKKIQTNAHQNSREREGEKLNQIHFSKCANQMCSHIVCLKNRCTASLFANKTAVKSRLKDKKKRALETLYPRDRKKERKWSFLVCVFIWISFDLCLYNGHTVCSLNAHQRIYVCVCASARFSLFSIPPSIRKRSKDCLAICAINSITI